MDETILTEKLEELIDIEIACKRNANLQKEGIRKAKELVNSLEQTDLQIIENYTNEREKKEKLKGLVLLTASISGGFLLGQLSGGEELMTMFPIVGGIYLGGLCAFDSVVRSINYSRLNKAIENDFYSGRTGLVTSTN